MITHKRLVCLKLACNNLISAMGSFVEVARYVLCAVKPSLITNIIKPNFNGPLYLKWSKEGIQGAGRL